MGLFGKSKEEKKDVPLPAAPPAVPAAPNAAEMSAPVENEANSVLLSPPVPKSGGSFDDIKSQVTSSSTASDVAAGQQTSESQSSGQPQTSESDSFNSEDDDSLFDFSSLEVDGLGNNSGSEASFSDSEGFTAGTELDVHENEQHSDLSFVTNRSSRKSLSEDYFVTTAQFKAFLEIIDSVKDRIKDSSERHLRLLDIKSEEDIEYENLRKDFQFVEDKLYEIDSLIFEK